MRVITAPHPTLRTPAKPVLAGTPKLERFLKDLSSTLINHKNPPGVGLAAPQVDRSQQVFATYLPLDEHNDASPHELRLFINPKITDHSDHKTFGPDKKHPLLEGCLSIPTIYGPVPRWEWVTVTFDVVSNGVLESHTEKFEAFAARVMQHEYDHLHGVLFTDYSLEFDLPLYQEQTDSEDLLEIDHSMIASL